MADEEKNEQQPEEEKAPEAEAEETPDAPKDDAPEQKDDSKEGDAPAGGGDEEAAADEGAAAEDASSDGEAEAPAAEGGGAGDDEEMDWKARRRLERSRQSGEAGPQRSPEERAKERIERRGKSAKGRSAYRRKQRTKREGGTGTPPADREAISAKSRRGRVVSSKPDKTITVQIEVVRRHPTYEKIVRRSRTLHAHDAQNEANEGDLVRVVETRPLSKTKRWRLVEILEKAQ
jgi:small subunit ribosomal protein S17